MSLIAGGACTFSKRPDQYIQGVTGPTCKSMTGHTFSDGVSDLRDTTGALGALLGSCSDGIMPLPSYMEEVLAKALVERIPCIEMVRYMLNGGDATTAALRYARAYTGRPEILYTGYHGCSGEYTYNTPPAKGCVNGHCLKMDTIEGLIAMLEADPTDVAAVIIEPIELDLDVRDKLEALRMMCTDTGVVLIFDCIITGGRVPHLTVANWYGIKPDLICLGKALGGGYPLSILGGRRDIMQDEEVFISYTFAGFPPSLDRAYKMLCELTDDHLQAWWDRCDALRKAINVLPYDLKIHGYATRGTWVGPDRIKYLYWQEMHDRGWHIGRPWFPRYDWPEQFYVDFFEDTKKSLGRIRGGKVKHRGTWPKELFKR